MPTEIKIYKVNDFIRLNESGEIDLEKSMELVHRLAVTASYYAGHNILIDLRETTLVGESTIGTVMQVGFEVARYGSAFKGKIANVVPGDEKRLAIAKQFEASLQIHGIRYRVFTGFEDAVDWLSDIRELGESKS
jgi:hypothetical protein